MSIMEEQVSLEKLYTPTADQVVIEYNMEKKTKTGLHIPDSNQKKDMVQRIVAVGPDVKAYKVGDYVLVSPMARPIEIALLQDNHVQIWERDLAGKVSPDYKIYLSAKVATAQV